MCLHVRVELPFMAVIVALHSVFFSPEIASHNIVFEIETTYF